MSAYMQDKAHIDFLVDAGLAFGMLDGYDLTWYAPMEGNYDPGTAPTQQHRLNHNSADEIGRMLWVENLRSVAARYPNDDSGERPGPNGLTDEEVIMYRHTPRRRGANWAREMLADIAMAISGYEYQSCEHEGWERSAAHAYCQALVSRVLHYMPGYSESEAWSISEGDEVLTRRLVS